MMRKDQKQFWHDDLGVVSIGAQCGGPEDGGLGDIKIDLWKSFLRNCRGSYCGPIRHFALALRIGGKFQEFQPEAIERIRRDNRQSCIGADIVIPVAVWINKTPNQLRDYLADQVGSALEKCLLRLERDGVRIDSEALRADFTRSLEEFRKMDFELDRN